MDLSESTKIVANRIQTLDPENVSKIIGYLLLQDHGEKEMLRLAFGPDTQLLSLISKAKTDLGLSLKLPVLAPIPRALIQPSPPISDIPLQFTPFTPVVSRPFSSPTTFQAAAAQYWEPQLVSVDQQQVHALNFVHPAAFADLLEDDYLLHDSAQFLSLEDQIEHVSPVGADFLGNYYHPESTLDSLSARSRRSPSLPEFPIKACHYFKKGYCKHGTNCRYLHGLDLPVSFSQIFIPSSNDLVDKDHVFPPVSLEKLELELMELLKSRKGMPVSIASLPMMYYEKYGKTLQAEGYLTESQRHGKAGYSLTKLLARLNNSIRLIDRPHGQHSVILAEDAPKYMEYRSERSDLAAVVAGSRQIYLTFPAESTFTEDDVSNYFMSFGPVQDVRIPCQQKRMFGFVTFLFPETVKLILQKGNPHFVCGSRVLVKPYKEKSRLVDSCLSFYSQFPESGPEGGLKLRWSTAPQPYIGSPSNLEGLETPLADQGQEVPFGIRASSTHAALYCARAPVPCPTARMRDLFELVQMTTSSIICLMFRATVLQVMTKQGTQTAVAMTKTAAKESISLKAHSHHLQ